MYFCDVQIQGTIETDGDDMTEEFRRELNFRELAGYISQDGRKIRSGMLYRSAALGLLNREERDLFRKLGIRTILDFRSRRAVRELPDPVFENCEQIAMCAAFENFREDLNDSPREFFQMLVDEDQQGNMTASWVASIHASLVYSNEAYYEMFRRLLRNETPLLFHCTQGKDRTGVGAMLILSALGVDQETIMADYLLTNEFNAEKIAKEQEMVKQLSEDPQEQELLLLAMDYVSETTMRNALDYLNGEYGSPVGYITQELGLTEDQITELQNKFLE
jgi:protein-tyrosine phosphatase